MAPVAWRVSLGCRGPPRPAHKKGRVAVRANDGDC
jgi:hypothetical protein